jgi:hypothetical protein
MRDHPDSQMEILCGHTHSAGVAQILPNLVVRTGRAEYCVPVIERVWELE